MSVIVKWDNIKDKPKLRDTDQAIFKFPWADTVNMLYLSRKIYI